MLIKHSRIFANAQDLYQAISDGSFDTGKILFHIGLFFTESTFTNLCSIYSCDNYTDEIGYFKVSVEIGHTETGTVPVLTVRLPIANGMSYLMDGEQLTDAQYSQLKDVVNRYSADDLSVIYDEQENKLYILQERLPSTNPDDKYIYRTANKILSSPNFLMMKLHSNSDAQKTIVGEEGRSFRLSTAFDDRFANSTVGDRNNLVKSLIKASDFYLAGAFRMDSILSEELSLFNYVKMINLFRTNYNIVNGWQAEASDDLTQIEYVVSSLACIDQEYSNVIVAPNGSSEQDIILQDPSTGRQLPLAYTHDDVLPLAASKRYTCVYVPYWHFTAASDGNSYNIFCSDQLIFIDPDKYRI